MTRERDQTIRDFGDQWTRHTENRAYYAGSELFADIIHPFLSPADVAGKKCADIGSGTGRIVLMMLNAGASHVTAIEPSAAFEVLKRNVTEAGDRVSALNVRGDEIPAADFDVILSIGVLHHIPEPKPVVDAAFKALRPGGKMLIWLYGSEGSAAYRSIFLPVRAITKRLPIAVNEALAACLYPIVLAYAALTRAAPAMPLADYLKNVFMRFGPEERRLVILDQINPQYAKYYTRAEAAALLENSGFRNVDLFHRHEYSWTVVGER